MGEYQQREIVRLRADRDDMEQQLAAERAKVAEATDILTNKVFKPAGAICCALATLQGDSE